jgi:hypothetical protein
MTPFARGERGPDLNFHAPERGFAHTLRQMAD